MQTNTLTHDTPLTSRGAQGELEFMHELRQLLNHFGVDNSCGTPDYILADLLKEHLRTWRFYATARDLHAGYPSSLNTEQAGRVVETRAGRIPVPMQRGTKGPIAQHAPLTEEEKADESVELARDIRAQLGQQQKERERLLNSMRELNKQVDENIKGFQNLRQSADPYGYLAILNAKKIRDEYMAKPSHLEIDVTKLSDAEKASILHAYDLSDDAPENALQRAGRRLMEEAGQPKHAKDHPEARQDGAKVVAEHGDDMEEQLRLKRLKQKGGSDAAY